MLRGGWAGQSRGHLLGQVLGALRSEEGQPTLAPVKGFKIISCLPTFSPALQPVLWIGEIGLGGQPPPWDTAREAGAQ